MKSSPPDPVNDDGLITPTDLIYRRLIGVHRLADTNANNDSHIRVWKQGVEVGIILNPNGFQYTHDGMSSYSHEIFTKMKADYTKLYDPLQPLLYLCVSSSPAKLRILTDKEIQFRFDDPSYETDRYKRKAHVLVGTKSTQNLEDAILWKKIRKTIIANSEPLVDKQYESIVKHCIANNWLCPPPLK